MLANGLARGNWPGATKAMARTPRTQEAKAVSSSYDCVRFVPSPTQSGSRSYCLDERGWWYPEDAGAGKECDTGAGLRLAIPDSGPGGNTDPEAASHERRCERILTTSPAINQKSSSEPGPVPDSSDSRRQTERTHSRAANEVVRGRIERRVQQQNAQYIPTVSDHYSLTTQQTFRLPSRSAGSQISNNSPSPQVDRITSDVFSVVVIKIEKKYFRPAAPGTRRPSLGSSQAPDMHRVQCQIVHYRRPPRPRIKHSSTESSPVALSATRKTLSTFGRGRFSPSSRKLFEGEAAIPCDRTGRLRRHHDPVTSQQQQQQQHRQQRHEGKTRQTMHVGMGHGQENIRICPKHMPMRPRIRKAYADSGPPVGQRDPALSTAAARKADGRKRRAPTFCHDRRQPGFGSAGPPSCVVEQTTNPLDNSDPQVASLSVFDSRIRATDSGNRPVYAAEIRAVPGPRRCRFLGAMIRKQKSCPHRASRISQSRITVVRRPGITPPPLAGSPRGLVSSCAQDAFRLSAAVNSFPVS
ncbi:hypothetical protein MPTK1_3g19810 [Marchantia polymorpha subsp. ruderalis]|uniref:Uncharacterized protein n=2 Tax=Marchantia polymorpha TaxID=3197 RepID=A0AAF6B2P7_MARPO|nr:hypothetical protein MARPO_0049s0053 [Marchantia polymorpha]BBN06281.1 hypothetical protein Mp_3g19810 [Marchantia polymorpha subsp. ruderalis]|eukprot:PTQ38762.1 hypothetical protein MARPO_0049s0053 [Marchantia polymorpha]